MFLKVKDESRLLRDSDTGAIIVSDDSSYAQYKTRLSFRSKQKERESRIDTELNNLGKEVSELKVILNQILTKLK